MDLTASFAALSIGSQHVDAHRSYGSGNSSQGLDLGHDVGAGMAFGSGSAAAFDAPASASGSADLRSLEAASIAARTGAAAAGDGTGSGGLPRLAPDGDLTYSGVHSLGVQGHSGAAGAARPQLGPGPPIQLGEQQHGSSARG